MRVPLVTLALGLAPALALPQSLGDAARRQAQDRAKRAPAAAKAYTDGDLRAQGADTASSVRETTPAAVPPSETPEGADAVAALPRTLAPDGEDPVRAQLDREAEERKQRELRWRRSAAQARARLDAAMREHAAACGPGQLVLPGG
jgi:hypothetical protein